MGGDPAGDLAAPWRRLLLRVPRWAYGLAAVAEITVLWLLSSRPGDDMGPSLPGPSSNLMHVVSNACLAFLLLRAFAGPRDEAWPGLRTPVGKKVLALVALWAVVDETHQFWVPGRTCSVLDVFSDILGGVFVLVWPGSGAGRPRRWPTALVVLVAAVAIAIYGWLHRPFPDRVLEQILEGISG